MILRKFIRRIKCRIGLHYPITQILWKRNDPSYGGIRVSCFRCSKVTKKEVYEIGVDNA